MIKKISIVAFSSPILGYRYKVVVDGKTAGLAAAKYQAEEMAQTIMMEHQIQPRCK